MSSDVKSTRARLDLLPGYPNLFDVMFDSVKIESSPVEAKDDYDSTQSDFSDDEEEQTGHIGYREPREQWGGSDSSTLHNKIHFPPLHHH